MPAAAVPAGEETGTSARSTQVVSMSGVVAAASGPASRS
jgi:hypothetical protein